MANISGNRKNTSRKRLYIGKNQLNMGIESVKHMEILDELFSQHLELAKTLMKQLKRPKDREIVAKFIRKCLALDSDSIEVKQNRNAFFKYFLKMLRTAASTQPPQFDQWFKPKIKHERKDPEKLQSYMSPDKRIYTAAKAISGFGTLVYIAVSYKPELGWQDYGFKTYEF